MSKVDLKQLAAQQVLLNRTDEKEKSYAHLKEVVARDIDLLTNKEYSEFMGYLPPFYRGAMTKNQAREIVTEINRLKGYQED